MRGGDHMGFGFWFGRTVVFSAGSFIPTSLATVARTGFNEEDPTRLTGRGPIEKQDCHFEPGFRPETAPFLEPAFSFNA
jgi:hypothetical protein